MSTFAQLNLNEKINQALTSCGYTIPTPVQAEAIPVILAGKDVVVSAQTGTGKTAAFVLPAIHHLSLNSHRHSKKPRILILTPTRELSVQVSEAAKKYGKKSSFNIVSLVGGMSFHHQIKDLAKGADIIVATPGRLLDHIEQKRVDLSGIEILVLDEADRMLDMGFIDEVEYIAKLTPTNRQTLLFSATVDKKLNTVVKNLLKQPVNIDLSKEKTDKPQIKQQLYKVANMHHKNKLLNHLLSNENIYKAIIFSATKINADKIAAELQRMDFPAAALHGDLKQNVRNRTLEQFRRGRVQFLVATDVAARGIDVGDITHVINYDLPRFCEDYVHRIGRTGRAGKAGIAISFVLPTDTRHLQRIERYTEQRIAFVTDNTIKMDGKGKDSKETPKIEIKRDIKRDTKRDYKRDTKNNSKREFKRDTKSDLKSDTKREFKKDTKRDFKSDTKRDFKSDIKRKQDTRGKPGTKMHDKSRAASNSVNDHAKDRDNDYKKSDPVKKWKKHKSNDYKTKGPFKSPAKNKSPSYAKNKESKLASDYPR